MDLKKILFKTTSIDVEKSLPDAVILTNNDGKIQWVNDIAAEFFETSKIHLMTSNISDFIENSKNLTTNAIISNRTVIAKAVNKENYYDLTVRDIPEGFVYDLRNISDNLYDNESEDEDVAVKNKDKNNFLIKLANDLKSPIQSIVGFSQAISDGLGGEMNEQQKKYIRIINKNSTDLMYFVSKLIELSQTEIEPIKPELKMADFLALVNSTVKYNEQLYKDKDVKIVVKTEENYKKNIAIAQDICKNILQDILEVILKSVDMGEVVVNLSTPDAEEIANKGLVEGNYTKISVSSSALLLSENDLECIFEPYKILDSTNRKNVLRAIVLASVKNLVQSLNGIIWVESQILKSTSFNVIIPIG